jgi:Spy/CpxP family protein refolding chaperone
MKRPIAKFALLLAFSAAGLAAPSPKQYSNQNGPSVSFGVAGGEGIDRAALLASMLSLNLSQQANAKAIFDDEDAISKPLVKQLNQASDALVSARKAAAPDLEIDQLARNMGSISGEILAIDAKAQSKIYGQLSAVQKQKLEQLPHPFFGVSAPLLPPGPVFVSTSRAHGQN